MLKFVKTCKGINFWINKIIHSWVRGLIREMLTNHLWKGGKPNLNIIKRIIVWERKEEPNILITKYKIKNITDATLWEMKYFNLTSEDKKESLAAKRGKAAIIFISNLTQRKKTVWVEKANRTLKKIINQNPKAGVKNIIKL